MYFIYLFIYLFVLASYATLIHFPINHTIVQSYIFTAFAVLACS